MQMSRSELSRDKTRSARVPIMFSKGELLAIDGWRFSRRIATRAGAVRALCAASLEEKGPAEAATSPSPVTETHWKGKPMNCDQHSTGAAGGATAANIAAADAPDICDVIDMLARALSFNQLATMAVTSMHIDSATNAIITGLVEVDDMLEDAKKALYAIAHGEGGAA